MKETVTDPLLFFLASILFGVCLQAIYDIIRGIRRVFYHKSVFLFIEDIGFGIFTVEQGVFIGLGRTKMPLLTGIMRVWLLRYIFISIYLTMYISRYSFFFS